MSNELSETDIFALLSKRRRRLALRIIRESSTPLSVNRLAERVAKREFGDPSAEELRAISLTLHHNHLPRLEADDVVQYDEIEGTVRPGVNFDPPLRFLEESREEDLQWSDI